MNYPVIIDLLTVMLRYKFEDKYCTINFNLLLLKISIMTVLRVMMVLFIAQHAYQLLVYTYPGIVFNYMFRVILITRHNQNM